MHVRAVIVLTSLVLAIFAGPAAINLIWAQVQPTPVSTSSLCFDPSYPRLVLQSGTGPRHVILPQGMVLTYQMPIGVLPAESTWKVSSATPWLSVVSTPALGPGSVPVTIAAPQLAGMYEGALSVLITGLFKDAQGNNVSTLVTLPVSLEVIPKPIAGPPPAPAGLPIQIDAVSGSSVLVITRRTPTNDATLTVNPGVAVTVKGQDCTAIPGFSRRCPVP